MLLFIIGCVICILALGVALMGQALDIPKTARLAIGPIGVMVGLILIVASMAAYIEEGHSGIIIRKFGSDLPIGAIIATNGEKGPQARIYPTGWQFFFPWLYEIKQSPDIVIPEGSIGVVIALDGKALPKGEIYAPEWSDYKDMLDAQKFLSSDTGYKGPQQTVVPPGQHRFNSKLFTIEVKSALKVQVGFVAVIKSNTGKIYVPKQGEKVEEVNGVPIVPNGFRGIWKEALPPNDYYMHPGAYVPIFVQTTKRVYSYTAEDKNAVDVKTKDGFTFPVDVRVSVKISAKYAPYVVAMLSNPDKENKKGFDVLEERAILPSIRSIFRNTAETKGVLEYLNTRSKIELSATELFKNDMEEFKIEVDRVYIASIGLGDTEQGKELLKTQTDKELAIQKTETYKEEELAEKQRASKVKAEEDANQEKLKAQAAAKVDIANSEAQAKIALAKGEAAAYVEKIKAFGSVNEYIKALAIEKLIAVVPQIKLPQTLVIGSGGDVNSQLLTPFLTEALKDSEKAKSSKK